MKDPFTDPSRARNTRDRLDLPISHRAFDRRGAVGPDDHDPRDEFVWEQVSNSWATPQPSRWLGRLVFAALGGVLAVGAMFAVNFLRVDPTSFRVEMTPLVQQQADTATTPAATPDSSASEPLPDLPDPPPLDPAPAARAPLSPSPLATASVPSTPPAALSAPVPSAPAAAARRAQPASPVPSTPAPTLGRSATATPSLRSTQPAAPIRSTQPTALPGPRPPLSQTARGATPDPDLDPPLAAWRAGFATAPPAVNQQVAAGSPEPAATPATQESRANAPGTRFPGPTEVRLPGTNEVRLPGVNEVRLPRGNDVRVPASPETRAPAPPPVATPQTPVTQSRVTSEEPRPAPNPAVRTPAASEAPAASAAVAPRTPAAAVVTPPPRATETTAIEGTLARYRDAFNKLDVGAASRVWPTVNGRSLSKAFEQLRQQQVSFDQCQIDVREVRAEARCSGTARYVPRVGSSSTQIDQRQWRFNLAKRGDEWLIQSVEAR